MNFAVSLSVACAAIVGCSSSGKNSAESVATGAVATGSAPSDRGASMSASDRSGPSAFPKEPLTFSTSPAAALRPFTERLLPNGLRILFVEDNALPYATFSLMVRAGSSQDPKSHSGLATMTSELLDQGSSKHTAVEIADALSALGSDFQSKAAEDYTMATVSTLAPYAGTLLDLFAEIVQQPSFAEAEVVRVRTQMLARVQKRLDDPNGFADAAFDEYLYGDHPYGRPQLGTATGVADIKKKNIILFYKRHYRPNNSILSVVGKIGPELREKVEKVFGAWQPQEIAPPTFPVVAPIQGVKIRFVQRAGLQQAQIRIGNVGIRRLDDDYLALRTANVILGGAFASRLVDRVRAKLGLTYSISSVFEPRLAPGPFAISTFTKPGTVGQTLKETLAVLREFCDKGATTEEVDRAKAYLKGLFPMAIETAEKFAQNLMVLRLDGVPDSYLANFMSSMDKMSASDVNRAVAKRMDAKNLKVIVYGPPESVPQTAGVGDLETRAATEVLN